MQNNQKSTLNCTSNRNVLKINIFMASVKEFFTKFDTFL